MVYFDISSKKNLVVLRRNFSLLVHVWKLIIVKTFLRIYCEVKLKQKLKWANSNKFLQSLFAAAVCLEMMKLKKNFMIKCIMQTEFFPTNRAQSTQSPQTIIPQTILFNRTTDVGNWYDNYILRSFFSCQLHTSVVLLIDQIYEIIVCGNCVPWPQFVSENSVWMISFDDKILFSFIITNKQQKQQQTTIAGIYSNLPIQFNVVINSSENISYSRKVLTIIARKAKRI